MKFCSISFIVVVLEPKHKRNSSSVKAYSWFSRAWLLCQFEDTKTQLSIYSVWSSTL